MIADANLPPLVLAEGGIMEAVTTSSSGLLPPSLVVREVRRERQAVLMSFHTAG